MLVGTSGVQGLGLKILGSRCSVEGFGSSWDLGLTRERECEGVCVCERGSVCTIDWSAAVLVGTSTPLCLSDTWGLGSRVWFWSLELGDNIRR